MSKTSVVVSGLAVVTVVGGLVFWLLSVDRTLVPIPTADREFQNQNPNAVASRWQWENFTGSKSEPGPQTDGDDPEVEKSRQTDEAPYDVVAIYNALQRVQLDEQGSVVPDQSAKDALEDAFAYLGPDLSPQAMSELQELIRIGLPGKAGEEAARIVKNYYDFRLAEEEFNQRLSPDEQLSSEDSYEKLVQLRRRFLGEEVAGQLFEVEDTHARHMLAAIAVQQDPNLTDEEKQSQQQALQKELSDRLLSMGQLAPEEAAAEKVRLLREQGASSAEIYSAREEILGPVKAQELAAADRERAQWEIRFDSFWQARENILQAGLDEAESQRQIELLLDQHFSPEEREQARLTSFEWQAREDRE